ncbi:hypothetical protein HanHA300_Chr09g0298951 [Helianthus annuus]|nr:hypothetical protein HanHA300_Chr09g0298951 [Helianthus annuus]KAJ0709807.1 hypothetical protein HanOQP8_Chr09g0304881 [Helianthus annuus]
MMVEAHSETSAFFDMHGRAVVGRVKDIEILINLNVLFRSAVSVNFKFYYLGGLNIMVAFEDEMDVSDFILNVQLWKEWFDSLDVWSGQTLAYERIVWLKFHGVPLHLAENKVFNDIASLFGKVIKGSELSISDWDLSTSYVGILVDTGARISGSTMIVWRNKKFKVWVMEELDDWMPDCMFEDERSSSEKVSNVGDSEANTPEANEVDKDLNSQEKD